MALSNDAKKIIVQTLTDRPVAESLIDAVDANTLKTGITPAQALSIIASGGKLVNIGAVTTTTTNATTTWLHTAVKAIAAAAAGS